MKQVPKNVGQAITLGVATVLSIVGIAGYQLSHKELVIPRPPFQQAVVVHDARKVQIKYLGNGWYNVGDTIDEEMLDFQQLDTYFTGASIVEGDAIYKRIYGKSYPTNKAVDINNLRYLKMLYVDYDGATRCGEMIVNAKIAGVTLDIFRQLFEAKYPIARMELIDNFWDTDGNTTDQASMHANNASSFCYRTIAGTSEQSAHALGLAIDINPHDNPYVWKNKDGSLKLEMLDAYEQQMLEDREHKAHAITEADLAYQLFTKAGFDWGGNWDNPLDYQHFEWKNQ
ncbi:MAG: M15 family metallopeptidase [Lachnospiraceae bacterium]|nr:M15 family metallopeptidase [Lachnospiraceae bacterium]